MGVRIGDGLGMPWESLTAEQIRERTDGKGVHTYHSPQQRSDAPAWALQLGILNPGDSTDDWQLTRATAQSLIRCGQLDLADLARTFVDEHAICRLGWGGTTEWGIAQIEAWFKTNGIEGRSPGEFPPNPESENERFGTGNGVAMRIAPIGLLASHAFSEDGRIDEGALISFMESVWGVGGLTHPDPRATVGAFAIASFIARLTAREGRPLAQHHLLKMFDSVLYEVTRMEREFASTIGWTRNREPFSARMNWIRPLILANASATQIRVKFGTSSYTLESAAFSIATFLRHPTDFRAALREAVEAGGDTDTNAAIVGSLVGANVGLEGIPEEWMGRGDFLVAETLGSDLWNLVLDILTSPYSNAS